MPVTKFRPYITEQELSVILAALKSQTPPPLGLIRYLETLAIKIDRGLVDPAVKLKPTIEEKLELHITPSDAISLEGTVIALVNVYENEPAKRARLSPKQIETIQQYRFINDRMSETEEIEYVSTLPKT